MASSQKPIEVITLYDSSDDEHYDDRNSMANIDGQRRSDNRRNIVQEHQVKEDIIDLTTEDDEQMDLDVSTQELPGQLNTNDSTYSGGDQHNEILIEPMQERSNLLGEVNQESNSLANSQIISKSFTPAINICEQHPAQKSNPSTIEIEQNQVQSSVLNTPINEIEDLERLEKENEAQRRQYEKKLEEVIAEGRRIKAKKLEIKRRSSGAASSQRMSTTNQLPHHGRMFLSHITAQGELVKPEFGSQGSITSETTSKQNSEQSPQETHFDISNFPVEPNFDPLMSLSKDQFTGELYDMDDEFKSVFHQANIPNNNVRIPVFRSDKRMRFYLLDLPVNIQLKIRRLGGSIVKYLSSATRIIFDPSRPTMNPEEDKTLFTLLTGAIGGRILLPVNYINECSEAKRFLSVDAYNTYSTYESLNWNVSNLVAAKMSIKYRADLGSGKFPAFYRSSVLFVGSKDEHVDVQLLLQLLGAYVQTYDSNEMHYPIYNPTINLIVTSRKHELPSLSLQVPRKNPDDVRRLLLDQYYKHWNQLFK